MTQIDFHPTAATVSIVADMTDSQRNALLRDVASAIRSQIPSLLQANAKDITRLDQQSPGSPLRDRLLLTPARLEAIAADMDHVATLPSPLGKTLEERTLPNGLRLRRLTVPLGVVGVIFEARPNVVYDVFSLCLKSGNAVVLKGGSDAHFSNLAAADLIHRVMRSHNLPEAACLLLPDTHEATAEMLRAEGLVDVCIPRGGRRLIDMVRSTARIPVIETGAGVVNTYFDASADLQMGARIICNAKTRRVSVCNALDCLLIHSSRLPDLPALVAPLPEKGVEIQADPRSYAVLQASGYPFLRPADSESFGTEFMALRLALRTVDSLDQALAHIAKYGSGHSETIITQDPKAADRFQQQVDAACVYVNAPTSFTDGAQFGLGAEIGISTQKVGPRGPMGLDALTTYRWLINGSGQIRP